MSTTDPVAARRARQARVPGPRRLAVAAVLELLGGLGLGYGWSTFGVLGAAAGAGGEFDPTVPALLGIVLGLPLTIAGTSVGAGILARRRDLGIGPAIAAFWLGGAFGIQLAALAHGADLLPFVLGALALAVVVGALAVAGARRRAAQRRVDDEMMRTGTLTTATVSDQGWLVFGESTRILTTVTFTFTDAQDVQRWVQRTMVIHAADPVLNGRETRLWYDPAAPGDERRIVVELARATPPAS
jgi:hypothetical protein